MRAATVIAVIAAATTPALSQSALPPRATPAVSAGKSIADEGDRAMARLRDAVTRQRQANGNAVPPTALPPEKSDPLRRRAFDALRHKRDDPTIAARARSAGKAGSAALVAERERMAQRLGQALGLEAPDITAITHAAAPEAPSGWVPVLFVSSSMPTAILRTYAGQLERAHGVMAFRGVPGGLRRIAPMARLSADILRVDPGCDGPACTMRDVQLIVDPLLFRQHGIARVPALAMMPGDPTQAYCEREDQRANPTPAARPIVYGDASLGGMLDDYARLGGKEEVRDAQRRLQAR